MVTLNNDQLHDVDQDHIGSAYRAEGWPNGPLPLAARILTIGEKNGGEVPFLLAANAGKESPRPTPEDSERLVATLRGAERVPSGSVGAGEYRILRGSVLGGEMVDDH